MKTPKDISIHIEQKEHIGEKRKTWAFISSVMSLYHPDVDTNKMDGIKATCLMYHDAINRFSETEFSNRLKMIKAISEVPNMPGLHGRYRTAQDALRIACGELCNLSHDYHHVVPTNYNTGELVRIEQREKENPGTSLEESKKHINDLKFMFGVENGN